MTGSHLDTQPTGGKFDGAYGVMAGLEVLRVLNDSNYVTEAPIEVVVWTNEEGGDAGQVTTVTFEEKDGKTLLVMHDLYPSKEALDEAIASGSTSGMPETFEQLDELLVTLVTNAGRT